MPINVKNAYNNVKAYYFFRYMYMLLFETPLHLQACWLAQSHQYNVIMRDHNNVDQFFSTFVSMLINRQLATFGGISDQCLDFDQHGTMIMGSYCYYSIWSVRIAVVSQSCVSFCHILWIWASWMYQALTALHILNAFNKVYHWVCSSMPYTKHNSLKATKYYISGYSRFVTHVRYPTGPYLLKSFLNMSLIFV